MVKEVLTGHRRTRQFICSPHRQFIVLRTVLGRSAVPAAPAELARRVKGASREAKIGEMPRVLEPLGQAREADRSCRSSTLTRVRKCSATREERES
jgi:hypothetical protein